MSEYHDHHDGISSWLERRQYKIGSFEKAPKGSYRNRYHETLKRSEQARRRAFNHQISKPSPTVGLTTNLEESMELEASDILQLIVRYKELLKIGINFE